MNEPYIKLLKRIVDWQYFGDAHVLQLLIYLLATVNFKTERWRGITIKAGQKITSIEKLANACECSKNTIQRCLKILVDSGTIEIQSDNKKTIITMCNYSKFQRNIANSISKNDMQVDTQIDMQSDIHSDTQHDTQVDINIRNKEYKKEKKDNIVYAEKSAKPKFNPDELLKNEPPEIRELLMRWIDYKKTQFGKAYKSDDSFKTFVKKLNQLSGGDFETAKAIIEQSIANTYQGIFELKKSNQNGNNRGNSGNVPIERIVAAGRAWADAIR